MKRVTGNMLRTMTRCLSLGDVIYLPKVQTDKTLKRQLRSLVQGPYFRDKFLSNWSKYPEYEGLPDILLFELNNKYSGINSVYRYCEPAWFYRLPDGVKRYLRHFRAYHGLRRDVSMIMPVVHYTSLGYVISQGGITDALINTLGLRRLQEIRQLGELHDPITTSDTDVALMSFYHNRLVHSLNVAAIARLIAFNNRQVLTRVQIATLYAAGLSHDGMTPAGGDTTMQLDPVAFDEEINFTKLLDNPDWPSVKRRYRISEAKLIEAVNGQGVLGQLLDIADRLSYISLDANAYVDRYENWTGVKVPELFLTLRSICLEHPLICDLWDTVRVSPESQVYFTNPKRLAMFLKLRMLMFHGLYFHPASRFREFVMFSVVLKYLYEQKRITREQLCQMNDTQLRLLVESQLGEYIFTSFYFSDKFQVEYFNDERAALLAELQLNNQGIIYTFIEKMPARIKTGTHYLVMNRDKQSLGPLYEVYPELTSDIDVLTQVKHRYRLYYFPENQPFKEEFKIVYKRYRQNINTVKAD